MGKLQMPADGRSRRVAAVIAGVGLLAVLTPAYALKIDFGDVTGTINTSVELGVQWRMQDRDSRLVGKSNLDPDLCAISSCQGHSNGFDENGNPEPGLGVIGEGPARNQRAVEAPGVFSVNADDGNLNFDKYDVTQGLFKFSQDISLDFDAFGLDWEFFTRYYGHYDFANYDRAEFHPNVITENTIANNPHAAPPFGPGGTGNTRLSRGEAVFIERNDNQQETVGLDMELLDFRLATRLPFFGDRDLNVTVGRQLINWGESTYLAVGSLNSFGALDANALNRPAFLNIDEVFKPLGAVSFKTDLTYDIGISGWYGYEWQPVVIPPPGAFLSFIDADTNNSAETVSIGFGKTPEDPNSLAIANQGLLSALAETSLTAELLPQKEAKDTGQYGLSLSMSLPDLLTGTELNFYFANYHSRLPYLSSYAGNVGCLEDLVPSGSQITDTLGFLTACPGASLDAALWAITYQGDPDRDPNGGPAEQDTGRSTNPATYSQPGIGGTAYPLDTVKFQLEYPEDIKLFGMSFNTAVGEVSLQGEFVYRPNDPLQVSLIDVGFSALATPFPTGCSADPTQCTPGGQEDFLDVSLPGIGTTVTTITGQEFVGPSYLLDYRGVSGYSGAENGLQPGDYIRGYEEFQTVNWILGATYILGPENWVGADQIIFLFELGGTHILDLPDLAELQIEGPGQYTHASAGADGSGADGNLDGLANSGWVGPSGARFNPQQANPDYWTTANSFGYDLIAIVRYESVFPGISFEPVFLIKHDVYGISPGPGERFVQGRQQYSLNIEMRVKNALSFTAGYQWYTGAKENNVLRDRDFAQMGVRYRF